MEGVWVQNNVDANVGINIDLNLNLCSDWNQGFASVDVDWCVLTYDRVAH